jgi:hypothetical protein
MSVYFDVHGVQTRAFFAVVYEMVACVSRLTVKHVRDKAYKGFRLFGGGKAGNYPLVFVSTITPGQQNIPLQFHERIQTPFTLTFFMKLMLWVEQTQS